MSGWRLVRERARLADTAVAGSAVLLAGACVIPLFTDLRWVAPAVVTVVVIALLGAASRGLGMPAPMVPIVQVLGLVLTVTTMFATEEAWARLLPTTEAWNVLRALLRQGLLDAQTFAAPVPPFPGLVLVAVGGIGLVALSTDTLFVSVRGPILAGLPLLALYLVPAVISASGAPWWSFAPAAVGWLLILAADQRERVRDWGGLPATTRVRGLSAAARLVGLGAITAATVVGILVPASASAPWRTGDGSGGGTSATGGAVVLDPLVSMRRNLVQANDTEVLTYRTQAPDPSYLRVSVLETFDGATWRPRTGLESGRDSGVALPGNVLSASVAAGGTPRVTGGDSFTYDISVTNLQNTYLPLPYPLSEVTDVSGMADDWRIDPGTGTAFSGGAAATGVSYRVAALEPRIESGQLRGADAATGGFWPLLSLPGNLPPRISAIAERVTADASTPYDKALALQRWFTSDGGFTYSTSVRSGAAADYIAEFLDDRVGYCEQFAGAMAVMARTLGIPSRVVVGFTQGSRAEDGTWQVTVRDAHAWPELWFDGVGWARFEPTPRSDATVQAPAYAPDPENAIPRGADDTAATALPEGLDALSADRSVDRSLPVRGILAALSLVALVVLALPMASRIVRRRRRLRGREYSRTVEGAWAEIGDLAVDLGQPWSASATPRQASDRLARGMHDTAADALRRVRREVERVRYARPTAGTGATEQAEAVRADVRVVSRELRHRVRWQARVAAYCWPSSERRRQRSSMRSMKPEDVVGLGADGLVGASASSAGRAPKAE